ncbi:hypothetical protein D8674_028772 [Pyrus ussuriensis x Pyrus communis]|uniref:Reverse transcriptase Ty1/copia-type domain-containing protein n=1 Tax=Pyrus ussuriensis x Pyrus communis TaxID=2448454 RepID=A0A5N5HXA3_9ROSA|nr:hypothetical protein D8674_028772 [Pyrus ussuriensis x Pyrus communis]
MADGSIIASSSGSASEMDINPNQRLSSVLLNEFNYLPWARTVSLALGGRSKLGFINGSQPAPDASSPEYGGWLCKDQLVMSWLLNSMERNIAEIFSYSDICATIQREEVRRKVMNNGIKTNVTEARAYLTNEKRYKGKNPHLKCLHCDNIGHVRDKCWILHPELKPDFMKDKSAPKTSRAHPRANTATSSSINNVDTYQQFTANPAILLNEFAAYLQQKKGKEDGSVDHEDGSTTALMGKFAGFLADADYVPQTDLKGIVTAFQTALKINELHDFWVVDSGATDHMTNQMSKLHRFEKLHNPSHVSVANGEGARIVGKGKIHLISDQIESMALYARLVARGFTQTFDVDYKETFAPVAKMNTVRVLLSVAVNKGWPMYQMDVKNASYMVSLKKTHKQDVVCKLHKSIYGLKQSPRAWYARLSSVLISVGFGRSNADSFLFVRSGTAGTLVVLVYVDDLIITGDNPEEIKELKHSLQQRFAIKDLGVLRYFLGIEMATSHKGFFLNQRKYVLDLLKEANMSDAKPVPTPLDIKLKVGLEGQSLPNISYYQRLVGKLIYLTITRPDITYTVSIVSQFMHSPTMEHFNLVKRILRYLKGSVGRGIIIKKNASTQITGYCDADWAGNSLIVSNLVSWKSKKQTVVARSSAEAEYRAMASTACELIWLKGLLCDLGVFNHQSMSLFCDNQAAMHIASNPVFHERTKHIEVDCHYVHAVIKNGYSKKLSSKSYLMAEDNPLRSDAESSPVLSSGNMSEVDVNPNQKLSSVLLNEFNYLPWSRAVSLALGGRSKLGFINGSIEVPDASSPTYENWLCKDQLVMSWLLNSMELFQLKKDISNLQQEGKPFVQLLGSMKSMWNELEMYRPHTTEASVLLKRAEEDKIFQLLSSLDSGYEDLRSHILMNPELPSFTSVCATIQREEVRRKVMNIGTKTNVTEVRSYLTNERKYKVKNPHLKCQHCNYTGHPEFMKDNKGSQRLNRAPHRANNASTSTSHGSDALKSFTANPAALINEFAAYLQSKKEEVKTLLGKFAGFLTDTQHMSRDDMQVVLIYVDDLIITGDNAAEISTLKKSLQQRFAIKDLGVLKYFLGIEMASSHKGLFLNQRKYVMDLLKDANMSDAKPALTPLDNSSPSLDPSTFWIQLEGEYWMVVYLK